MTVATPSGENVQTMVGDKDRDAVVPTDIALSGLNENYDVIVLPGGTLNADAALIDPEVQQVVRAQAEAGRTIAAICHAPWVLVELDLARGKKLTSFESIRVDMINAGADWVDEPVVTCDAGGWLLITSRNPGDLKEFCAAIDGA